MEILKSNRTLRKFSITSTHDHGKEKHPFSIIPDPYIDFYDGKLNPYNKNQLKVIKFTFLEIKKNI